MDWKNLIVAVLTPVVAFGIRALFALIGFEVDDAVLMSLVAAIVAYLVSLVIQNAGASGVRKLRGW